MALTDVWLRAAKVGKNKDVPDGKTFKKSDGGGLFILIKPNGKMYWRCAYRFAGKQKTLAIGPYPLIGLAAAREARDDAKRCLLNNQDPAIARKVERAAQKASGENIFEIVAREWHEAQRARWTPEHAGRVIRRLERDIFPYLGKRPIAEIEPPEMLEVLRKVEARGALDITKRLREHCGNIFSFAIADAKYKITLNPCTDIRASLKAAPPKKGRAAIPLNELPAFLRQLDTYDGETTTRLALKFIILTMVRTKELRGAQWCEFEKLDGDALWRIPPTRMKMRREHLVPLPRQAVEILNALRSMTGWSDYLFPGHGRKRAFMSENTMLYALYRMGYHSRATVHGFRSVASTILNEEEFNSDWIERQLAHDEEDDSRAAYNSAQYLKGRRAMLQWYADHLDKLKLSGAKNAVRLVPSGQ